MSCLLSIRGPLGSGRVFDMLFVNPGTTTKYGHVHIGDVTTEEFMCVMITNRLEPHAYDRKPLSISSLRAA